MSAIAHAAAVIRTGTGFLASLLLFACSAPQPVASPPSQPVPTKAEAPAQSVPESESTDEDPAAAATDANSIYFQLRSTVVDEAGKQKLREHAERLKLDPKQRVTLIGHMDDLGSRNYNLAITEERLTAVSSQLRAYGVPARQIRRDRAAGESGSPRCKTEACRALMRRVELKYSE
ncbi:MAG: OmpA family protein [Propionivibrio sp.]